MKRSTISLTVLAMLLFLGGIPALAQHGHGGGPPAGKGPGTASPGGISSGKDSSSTPGKKTPDELLARNPKLTSKLQTLIGQDPQVACKEFKNVGQCVAAAHVAHNLGGSCTFANLKGATTGSHPESLGQAIHGCNPHVDAKAEAKKGKKQADDDLKESGS
jgi:hypothetical protein